MSGPRRYGLPHAMGDVSPWGDVAATLDAIRQRMRDRGPQTVLVSAAGRVYLMRPNDPATEGVIERYREWHIGDFTADVPADHLRAALVHTYQQALRALQAPMGARA